MSNHTELTRPPTSGPPMTPAAVGDIFKAYGRMVSKKQFVGTLLKFTKGDWKAGQNEDEIEVGSRFVMVMPSLTHGWTKWLGGHPVDNVMGLLTDGFMPPARPTLSDWEDKSQWEADGNGGAKKDPWAHSNMVIMVDESKNVFTFTTGSKGGMSAIGEVAMTYGERVCMHPEEIPVVEIGTGSYKHADYGKVFVPTFKIVDWVKQGPLLALIRNAEISEVGDNRADAPARMSAKMKATPPQRNKKKGKGIRF